MSAVHVERDGPVWTVILHRAERRNAVDRTTADALSQAFRSFDADPTACVAVLWGAGGTFCAGADLKAIAEGQPNRLAEDGDGPMGPSRLRLDKPVIAAISGHAVAGGLELACWCDLRVVEEDAVLGVFCRRWGVPLIDGGTVRLPRIIGLGRALDLVLTGRAVHADEALHIGLADRVVPPGTARQAAEDLAHQLALLPQACMRADRRGVLRSDDLSEEEALTAEFRDGLGAVAEGGLEGAMAFAGGAGRGGGPREGGAG